MCVCVCVCVYLCIHKADVTWEILSNLCVRKFYATSDKIGRRENNIDLQKWLHLRASTHLSCSSRCRSPMKNAIRIDKSLKHVIDEAHVKYSTHFRLFKKPSILQWVDKLRATWGMHDRLCSPRPFFHDFQNPEDCVTGFKRKSL